MSTTLARRNSGNRTGLSSIFSADPFNNLRGEFDQMLSNWFADNENAAFSSFSPSLDLKETDANYEVHADLPGLKANEINVQLVDNVLTISGERKYEKTDGNEKDKKERNDDTFRRTFSRHVLAFDHAARQRQEGQSRRQVP